MHTGKNSSELETGQIIIDRVRYFHQFETPSSIKSIEEITFNNKGAGVSSIEYYLGAFRPFLHIFDSNGEQLEFCGCADVENEPSYKIKIEFPKERHLDYGKCRTIRLEYVQKVKEMDVRIARIIAYWPGTANIYTFIKQCENYEFIVHYWVEDKENNELENVLKVEKGSSFIHLYSKAIKNDCNIIINLEHKIPSSLSKWYNIGATFGIISFVSIPILYNYNPEGIKEIVGFAVLVITILIIIKGWLFSKNMDRQLKNYDLFYQALIVMIFAAILAMYLKIDKVI